MPTIGVLTGVVLGSLCLFFTHAIVKAQLVMRGVEGARRPHFGPSGPAAESAQATV